MKRIAVQICLVVAVAEPPLLAAPVSPQAVKQDIQRISESIRNHPTAEKFSERARLHALCRDALGAVDDDSRAIELAPQRADYYVDRATDLSDLNRLNEAIADCNKALTLAKYGSTAYMGALRIRANAFFEKSQFDKAKSDILILIKLGDSVAPKSLQQINRASAARRQAK
jgi:tetratricopeptide (TPR) repeat protein